MSIDDLARAAAADVRRRAAREVVPERRLGQLHRTRRTNNVLSVVAVLTIGAVVLIGGGALFGHNQIGTPGSETASVPTTPSQPRTPSPDPTPDPCHDPAVTCLGTNRFRVQLAVPVTVTLPANFEATFSIFSRDAMETHRSDLDTTGVTVLEHAIPVKYDASWTRDPTAGTSAKSVASWLFKRPFLTHATLTQVTLDGRIAWRVTADLKPGAALPAAKSDWSVAPTFVGGPVTEGYRQALNGEYTLLDVPGAGVTVIWSWSLGQGPGATLKNQDYVDSLTFG